MLRLSTPGYLRFSQAKQYEATFGGGEANVAVSLANYGIDAEFVTRFPDNDIAKACIRDSIPTESRPTTAPSEASVLASISLKLAQLHAPARLFTIAHIRLFPPSNPA